MPAANPVHRIEIDGNTISLFTGIPSLHMDLPRHVNAA